MIMGEDFNFLYWDDLGDNQDEVDNQKHKGAIDVGYFDYFKNNPHSADYEDSEDDIN